MANLFADIDNAPNKESDYEEYNQGSGLTGNVGKYINKDYYQGNDMSRESPRIQQQLMDNQGARMSQNYQNRSSNQQNFGSNMIDEIADISIDSKMLNEIDEVMQKDNKVQSNIIQPGQKLPAMPSRMQQNTSKAPQTLNKTNMQNKTGFGQVKTDSSKLYTKAQSDIDIKSNLLLGEAPKYYNNTENKDMDFYWADAHEDAKMKSMIHLIGKVQNPKDPNDFCSADVKIRNMKRNIFIFKKMDSDCSMDEMQEEVEGKIKYKHSFIYSKMKIKQVKKYYAFELNVSRGEVDCIKISYVFDYPAIDIPFEGKTYKGIFGTTYTPTELFLVKRRIMGPCWLTVQNTEEVKTKDHSYCNYEFQIDTYKDLGVHEDTRKVAPPFKALIVSMEMAENAEGAKKSQITCISTLFTDKFNIEFSDPNLQYKPSVFVQAKGLDQNQHKSLREMFGESINVADKEYGLLSSFLQKVNRMDPDIIIGHDLNSVFMDNLLSRISENKIEFTSLLSKIKRSSDLVRQIQKQPSKSKVRQLTVGRMLCDTFISSKELIRESEYSLPYISKKLLGVTIENKEDDANMSNYESLVKVIDATIRNSHLSVRICNKLQIVQLTKQLTNVAGCLWIKSLLNARAERNEALLMHMFWKKGYVVPDKFNDYSDRNADDDDKKGPKNKKNNKKKYAGGLVLEPQAGLYDDIILLLDFNSLYPSIIREYKICFTTVQRTFVEIEDVRPSLKLNKEANKYDKEEGEEDHDDLTDFNHDPKLIKDDNKKLCILPDIIKLLLDRRKAVKNAIKSEKNQEKLELLDIRQKAYKLIANSIYGCLGFTFSRFYAKTLAAMITNYGRNLLTASMEKVNSMNYEVIYGDTDSLMINSRQKDTIKALAVGTELKKEINQSFKSRILEIEIDGVFKNLLLLKKKK